ncbi:MAG: hypothetical protein NFCOHLIN_02881 [Gammaproteobacteria bacterium]|nr:hypothetical protein [Gammaproteobacteria bacterium]
MQLPPLGVETTAGRTVLSGFGRPMGLAAGADGSLYVADMDLHAIARLTPDLDRCTWLGLAADGWREGAPIKSGTLQRAAAREPAMLNGPHSVAPLPDGACWIVTYYRPSLALYDAGGVCRACHTSVADLGPLQGPATARFDSRGRLLLTEYRMNVVAVIGEDAVPFMTIGGTDPVRPGMLLDRPHMTIELRDGTLVVADTWNHRLQRFDAQGRRRAVLESREGWRDGDDIEADEGFMTPVAVAETGDGRLLVTDWGGSRLMWFDEGGGLLQVRDDLGLDRPYDAQILHDRLVVADSHHGRIIILRDC